MITISLSSFEQTSIKNVKKLNEYPRYGTLCLPLGN